MHLQPGDMLFVPQNKISKIQRFLPAPNLDGIEGVLASNNGNKTLVISIEPIQRSIAISVSNYDLEPA